MSIGHPIFVSFVFSTGIEGGHRYLSLKARSPYIIIFILFRIKKDTVSESIVREKVRKKHLYFASLFFKDLLTFLLEMATI